MIEALSEHVLTCYKRWQKSTCVKIPHIFSFFPFSRSLGRAKKIIAPCHPTMRPPPPRMFDIRSNFILKCNTKPVDLHISKNHNSSIVRIITVVFLIKTWCSIHNLRPEVDNSIKHIHSNYHFYSLIFRTGLMGPLTAGSSLNYFGRYVLHRFKKKKWSLTNEK